MKKCYNCGNILGDADMFCEKCGANVGNANGNSNINFQGNNINGNSNIDYNNVKGAHDYDTYAMLCYELLWQLCLLLRFLQI